MAAEAELDDASAAPAKKGPKLIVIIGAAVGLVLALGAGAYFLLFSGNGQKDAHGETAAALHSFIFNLPTMTVNLNSDGGPQTFMKLSVAIEVPDEAMMTEIQPRMAKVVDAFQVYLRELRKSDLEGSAGIYRLKEELRRRVNVAIYPASIDNILFKEILVQ
jgi:flagellar FliL protein